MIILYKAFDGTIFENEQDCIYYEDKLTHIYLNKINFYTKENKEYHINLNDLYSDDVYQNCEKVIIHDYNEFKDFRWLAEECGWCEFDDIIDFGIWTRYEDSNRDGHWRKEIS